MKEYKIDVEKKSLLRVMNNLGDIGLIKLRKFEKDLKELRMVNGEESLTVFFKTDNDEVARLIIGAIKN